MEPIPLKLKKIQHIPFLEADSIPALIKDFLKGDIAGFEDKFFSLENFKKQIKSKEFSFSKDQRHILAEVLYDQMKSLQLSGKQHLNLELIHNSKTFTITTGHQLNLFTGPAFFVYKILQTIKTAEFLKGHFPHYNFVPLFWMASEDHDFEEINHFKTENHYYEIAAESGGPLGRIKIQDQFFINEFENEFRDSVYGTELIRWMKEAYAEGNTLAEATKILVNTIFSEYGLLIVDGDDARLKKQMITVFEDELLNSSLLNQSRKKVEYLTEKYSKVQVNPREINLFYLSDTRDRIEKRNGEYVIIDKNIVFTEQEILQELNHHPENFSPNALLRPVYQEKILPNLAYVGGNAEIMYWLELKDYFDAAQIDFPILVPRNSMLYLSEKIVGKVEKLDLSIPDFFKNFADIIAQALLLNSNLYKLISEKEHLIAEAFSQLKEQAVETDKTFKNLLDAEQTRQLKSYKRMHKRLLRAEKIKQSEKVGRMESLFLKIHPGKNWQERIYNFSIFYADFGKNWLQNCYSEIDVDKSGINVIQI